jgi:hypothetical protein
MTDFSRTLRTARDAEDIAKLLDRAAALVGYNGLTITEGSRLLALSARYRDYAAALRETAEAGDEPPEEPDLDQSLLEF